MNPVDHVEQTGELRTENGCPERGPLLDEPPHPAPVRSLPAPRPVLRRPLWWQAVTGAGRFAVIVGSIAGESFATAARDLRAQRAPRR